MKEHQDQEITIYDIFDFFRKYYIFILSFTVFFTLVAFIYTKTQAPVYGARGVVKIPQDGKIFGSTSTYLSPEALKEIILGLSYKNKEYGKYINNVDTLRKVKDLVEIEAHAPNLEKAKKAVNKIFNDIFQTYENEFKTAELERENTKKRLELLFDLLEKQASKALILKNQNNSEGFLVASQFSASITTISSLIEAFHSSQVTNFELISLKKLGKVRPMTNVIVGLSFFLGLLISLLIALALDVIKKYKIYLSKKDF